MLWREGKTTQNACLRGIPRPGILTLSNFSLMSIIFYDDISVNCSWVPTRWQQHGTHLHTNSTQNDTKQTIHRTTQHFGRVRAVPHLCGVYPGICLTTEEKSRKILSQGSRRVPTGTMKIHKHTIRICRRDNKNTQILFLEHSES